MAEGQSYSIELPEQRHHGFPQGEVRVFQQSAIRQESSVFRHERRQHPIVPKYNADSPHGRKQVPVVQEARFGAYTQARPAPLSRRILVQLDGEAREPDVLSRASVRCGYPAETESKGSGRHRLRCEEPAHAVHRRET